MRTFAQWLDDDKYKRQRQYVIVSELLVTLGVLAVVGLLTRSFVSVCVAAVVMGVVLVLIGAAGMIWRARANRYDA